jgi:hypothetical protein
MLQACKHESLQFVGEQRTDEGANIYYKCTACGELLVVTPSRKVIGIPGIQAEDISGTAGTQSQS